MMHKINFGNKVIDFDIEYRKRKTLEISVSPDGKVSVIAPLNTPIIKIEEKVKKRGSWILKHISYFSEIKSNTTPRKYISGETHRYLGKQYRLKILASDSESIKYVRGYIYITVKDKTDTVQIKNILNKWYIERAKIKFKERLNYCYEKLRKYGIKYPELQIKSMKKRWGSCTGDGKIILNSELIKVSLICVDFIIIHELCHLKYHNHSKSYYDFLSKILPNWKQIKIKLEKSEL